MGFNWMDVANVAVGAIDRDREITKEDLAIRADNLKAERDSLIRRKDAKYDYELKKFYKEKEKADEIKSLNAEALAFNKKHEGTDITFDQEEYADRYLMIKLGVDKFNALSDERKKILRAEFGGTNRNYEFDEKYLENYEAKSDADKKRILKSYSDELSNAKGDSFLINTILSKTPFKKKETEKISLLDNETKIDSDEKVETAIEEVEKIDTTDTTDTKDTTDSITLSYTKRAETPNKDYNTRWNSLSDKIKWDINSKENTFKYLNTMQIIGAGNELSFKFNATDSQIEGVGGNGTVNLLAIEKIFEAAKNSKNDASYIYNNVSKLPTEIEKHWSPTVVWSETSKAINNGRATTKKDNISSKGTDKYILTTIVPVSVVGLDGSLKLGDSNYDVNDKTKMKNISKHMSEFIHSEASKIDNKFLDSQGKVNKIYTALIDGDETVVNDFKNYLYANDNEVKKFYDENKTTSEGETKTTSVDKTVAPDKVANEQKIKKDIADNKIRTVVVTIEGEKKEVPLTDKNKEILDANKIDYSVKEDKTTGDAAIAEQMGSLLRKDDAGKTIKITPKDIGKINQPVFESLKEIMDILPNEMTGKEIKEKYEINFPLNDYTVFRPSAQITERGRKDR